MVKTDYKAGDYIWGNWMQPGDPARLIINCNINGSDLEWNENSNVKYSYGHSWKLAGLRLATDEEIIAAGFKVKPKTIEIW